MSVIQIPSDTNKGGKILSISIKGRRDSRSREFRERYGLKIHITDTRDVNVMDVFQITDSFRIPVLLFINVMDRDFNGSHRLDR